MDNAYKNSIKVSIVPKKPSTSIMEKLNLADLPENIKVSLSPDNSCINLYNTDFKNPLVFRIPIHEEDFSLLSNNPRNEELLNRYKLYSTEYKDIITNYSIAERKFLQERFPDVVFNIKIRQKSEYSYKKKLNDKLKKDPNSNLFLHDLIAERIIITQLDKNVPVPADSKEFEKYEKELQKTCFEFSEALNEFRRTSEFSLIQEKNYIENPKASGYQSIHDIMQHNLIPDCMFETQIRTLYMEEVAKTGDEIAHTKYKPRLLNDVSISKLPRYTEITPFLDAHGNPTAINISKNEAFYHFYGVTLENFESQLNTLLPYITDFRNSLHQLFSPNQKHSNLCIE